MKQGKKKITAFILLLLVAMPVFFSLVFMLGKKLLQEEAEEKLDVVKLQTIKISTSKLYWVRSNKEVIIDGKLFDVKTWKISNDIVTLTGFFDTKETELQETFTTFIEHSHRDAPINELALKFLFSPVYQVHEEIVLGVGWHYVSSHYFPFDEMIPAAPSLLFSPPPRLQA